MSQTAHAVAIYNESDTDNDDLGSMFRFLLVDHKKKHPETRLTMLPYLSEEDIQLMSQRVFYDKDYFFLKDRLFKEIICPLTGSTAVTSIMRRLSEEGTLACTSPPPFTVKMTYHTADESGKRVCMLRFRREKLQRCGDLDIIKKMKLDEQKGVSHDSH